MNKKLKISQGDIIKIIPKHCLKKDATIGIAYALRDVFFWILSILTYNKLLSQIDTDLKFYILTFLYWNVSGFFMWCLFMTGHDCGHGSFSNNSVINFIWGHLSHTPLLTPYCTWAESHRRHHVNHNHVKKDFSHIWVPKHYKSKKPLFIKFTQMTGLYPIIGWFFYLLGAPDGGHWIPGFGRLWKKFDFKLFVKCTFSSVCVFGFVFEIYKLCNYNFNTFFKYYLGSWFVFCWWLVTVTYLQHHNETVDETIVYGDKSWTFLKGALQTVDRKYGYGLDDIMHNITDGHLVHHMFFTKIPHYHLKDATKALYKYLDDQGVQYSQVNSPYFFFDIFSQTYSHLSEATLVK